MDKIKPYLFWVICGIILLIELILIVVIDPVNADHNNVYKAAKKLDDSVKSLETGYYKRANTKVPDKFAIDEVSYFEKLKTEHLVSQSWMTGLEQAQSDLEKHKANVSDDLRKRSAILHQSMVETPTHVGQSWYIAYEDKSFALLAQLREHNQLALNGDPFARADSEESVLREDATLRKIAGFYTKGGKFPEESEWPTITRRFRISEGIIKATLNAEASLLGNTKMSFENADFVLPPDGPVRPQLVEITWGTPNWGTENTIPIKGGEAVKCKVKFKGSVAALLAVTAKIESLQQPIFVVYGSQWTQPSRNSRNEAEKRVDTPMEMTLNLGILDYQGGQP